MYFCLLFSKIIDRWSPIRGRHFSTVTGMHYIQTASQMRAPLIPEPLYRTLSIHFVAHTWSCGCRVTVRRDGSGRRRATGVDPAGSGDGTERPSAGQLISSAGSSGSGSRLIGQRHIPRRRRTQTGHFLLYRSVSAVMSPSLVAY